jgi:ABC-type bacteriocin/lantibiotic exporter with double-glycine peptidase domain
MTTDVPAIVGYTIGASGILIGGLSLSQWAAIAGIATCVITSVLQIAKFWWDIKHTERRAKPRDGEG